MQSKTIKDHRAAFKEKKGAIYRQGSLKKAKIVLSGVSKVARKKLLFGYHIVQIVLVAR